MCHQGTLRSLRSARRRIRRTMKALKKGIAFPPQSIPCAHSAPLCGARNRHVPKTRAARGRPVARVWPVPIRSVRSWAGVLREARHPSERSQTPIGSGPSFRVGICPDARLDGAERRHRGPFDPWAAKWQKIAHLSDSAIARWLETAPRPPERLDSGSGRRLCGLVEAWGPVQSGVRIGFDCTEFACLRSRCPTGVGSRSMRR